MCDEVGTLGVKPGKAAVDPENVAWKEELAGCGVNAGYPWDTESLKAWANGFGPCGDVWPSGDL